MHFIFDFFGTLVTYHEGVRGNPVTHHEPMVVGLIERLNMRHSFQRVTDSFFQGVGRSRIP